MEINGNLLNEFIAYQVSIVVALLPLLAATISIFLTFSIANSVRFFIQKLVK